MKTARAQKFDKVIGGRSMRALPLLRAKALNTNALGALRPAAWLAACRKDSQLINDRRAILSATLLGFDTRRPRDARWSGTPRDERLRVMLDVPPELPGRRRRAAGRRMMMFHDAMLIARRIHARRHMGLGLLLAVSWLRAAPRHTFLGLLQLGQDAWSAMGAGGDSPR